eukprot:6172004-Pleurochrysis_carterae.AAC.6
MHRYAVKINCDSPANGALMRRRFQREACGARTQETCTAKAKKPAALWIFSTGCQTLGCISSYGAPTEMGRHDTADRA